MQERCRAEEEEIKGLERELLERETTFKVKQEQLGEMRRHISSLKEQQDEMERQVRYAPSPPPCLIICPLGRGEKGEDSRD